jgi:hypothetical protein
MAVDNKTIKKVEKKLNDKFMIKALELHNDKNLDAETKKLDWAMLVNTMTTYARSKARRLTEDELRSMTTQFITLVTGDAASETVPDGLLTGALNFGVTLQDEMFKTRCWGLCKS